MRRSYCSGHIPGTAASQSYLRLFGKAASGFLRSLIPNRRTAAKSATCELPSKSSPRHQRMAVIPAAGPCHELSKCSDFRAACACSMNWKGRLGLSWNLRRARREWPLLATGTDQWNAHKENARYSGDDEVLRISGLGAQDYPIRKPMIGFPWRTIFPAIGLTALI